MGDSAIVCDETALGKPDTEHPISVSMSIISRLGIGFSAMPHSIDRIRLQNRYAGLRENLFLFLDDPRISPTNNTSEQALRRSISIIFRKVTNGFRSDWVRDVFACVRSVVNTGKRQGLSMLDSILIALDPLKALFPVGWVITIIGLRSTILLRCKM